MSSVFQTQNIDPIKMCDESEQNFKSKPIVQDVDRNEKENKKKTKRVIRTKKEQLDLITKFMNENNVQLLASDIFDEMWSKLVDMLNAAGPPDHSNVEWKRIWSEHKYNKKRKRPDLEGSSQSTVTVPPNSQPLENISNFGPEHSFETTVNNNQQNSDDHSNPFQNANHLVDLNEYFLFMNPASSFESDVLLYDQFNGSDMPLTAMPVSETIINPLSSQPSIVNVDISTNDSAQRIIPNSEIGSQSSEVLKRLDVLIDQQSQTIQLLKQLVNKK